MQSAEKTQGQVLWLDRLWKISNTPKPEQA